MIKYNSETGLLCKILIVVFAGNLFIYQQSNAAAQGAWRTAEIISACAIAPASIAAQITRDYDTEKARVKAATIVSLARLTHSSISSYNHRNDWYTNKYNLFGLCVNGCNFLYNAYKLSTLPKVTEVDPHEEMMLAQRRSQASVVTVLSALGLAVAESGLAIQLATGGEMPTTVIKPCGLEYNVALSKDHTAKFPAFSSGLLSMLRCYNNFADTKNPKLKLAWLGALLGNGVIFKKDYKNWYYFDEDLAKSGLKPNDQAIQKEHEKELKKVEDQNKIVKYKEDFLKDIEKDIEKITKEHLEKEKALEKEKSEEPKKKAELADLKIKIADGQKFIDDHKLGLIIKKWQLNWYRDWYKGSLARFEK